MFCYSACTLELLLGVSSIWHSVVFLFSPFCCFLGHDHTPLSKHRFRSSLHSGILQLLACSVGAHGGAFLWLQWRTVLFQREELPFSSTFLSVAAGKGWAQTMCINYKRETSSKPVWRNTANQCLNNFYTPSSFTLIYKFV